MIANTYVVKPFGISEVKVIALKGEPGGPTQEQVNTAVEEYMDDHPEAQIPDGAVTTEKLASNTVAPYADNLTSSSYVSDSEPYLFRKTFAGVREDTEIVGGSVVWNQLSQTTRASFTGHGLTYVVEDGKTTVTGTFTGNASSAVRVGSSNKAIPTGHKVALLGGKSDTWFLRLQGNTYAPTKGNDIVEAADGALADIVVRPNLATNTEVNETFYFQIIDLTLMFGPTVADYIYSLETATAGAGVAFFRSLFDKPYYAYNAGTLMSVNTSAHKMVGFNQWDEEWEVGAINMSTGLPSTSADNRRTKNFVPVLPNATYCYTNLDAPTGIRLVFYDAGQNKIGGVSNSNPNPQTFTTPTNTKYIKFYWGNISNVCINFTSSRNGQYEPYVVHTYPLDSSLTLRGLPKLDGDNLYYDGDVYKSDGTVERKYGIVDLGTLNWARQAGSGGVYVFTTSGFTGKAQGVENLISDIFATTSVTSWGSGKPDNSICGSSSSTTVTVRADAYSTAEALKTALSGHYAVYEIATPTTETADPYTNPQVCYPDGTEEYIDTREVPIPVGHNTKYMRDLKKLLEGIPDAPTTNGTYVLKATVSSSGVTYAWVEG